MKQFSHVASKIEEQDDDDFEEPEIKVPVVRTKAQERKHRVISFGYTVTIEGQIPDVYKFQYPPVVENPDDLHPGVIPAGFSSGVEVDDDMIFFHTKEGPMGPEYQVAYTHPDNVLLDWTDDVDALWIESLQSLEDNHELSEDALSFLDADPLFLFGIADPTTQKALEKAASVPMLKCMGTRPCNEEWFHYLNADPELDTPYSWVIESFSEVELPPPWTSYKGVGSIVCYLNNETNETTWKHPFYDYFAQLLDHCRRANREEHIKLRINRMLWNYEAEAGTDVQSQQPLISPKYVKQMADMLEIDLTKEPYMVKTLKHFLKIFSQQTRYYGEIEVQEVKFCIEIAENEQTRNNLAKTLGHAPEEEESEQIHPSVHAQLYCVECQVVATCYCPECKDSLCEACFERLHSKGNRSKHIPNHLIPCCLCRVMPSKLQCTYTFANYCHECYARKHVKTLPTFLDLKPIRIDYTTVRKSEAEKLNAELAKPEEQPKPRETFSVDAPLESVLGEEWHAFYDLRGIKYYYNFKTQESMRRPHNDHMKCEERETLEEMNEKADLRETIKFMAVSKEDRKLYQFAREMEDDGGIPVKG